MIGRVVRRRDRGGERLVAPAGLPQPTLEHPRGVSGHAVVVVARLAGLARGHAADADREDQPGRERDRPLAARRAERVLRHA